MIMSTLNIQDIVVMKMIKKGNYNYGDREKFGQEHYDFIYCNTNRIKIELSSVKLSKQVGR